MSKINEDTYAGMAGEPLIYHTGEEMFMVILIPNPRKKARKTIYTRCVQMGLRIDLDLIMVLDMMRI